MKNKISIKHLIKIINLGAKNCPVGKEWLNPPINPPPPPTNLALFAELLILVWSIRAARLSVANLPVVDTGRLVLAHDPVEAGAVAGPPQCLVIFVPVVGQLWLVHFGSELGGARKKSTCGPKKLSTCGLWCASAQLCFGLLMKVTVTTFALG